MGSTASDVRTRERSLYVLVVVAKSVKLVCLEQREKILASEEEIQMALEEGAESGYQFLRRVFGGSAEDFQGPD